MKNMVRIILCLAASAALFASCVRDQSGEAGGQGEGIPVPVTIGAKTRAMLSAEEYKDYELTSIRVLGYHTSNGVLAFNRLINDSDFTETNAGEDDVLREVEVDVIVGDFTVIFIGNESLDGALAAKLADDQQVYTMTKLRSLAFDHSAFDWNKSVPMFARYDNVKIIDHNSISVGGTPVNGTWEVSLDRLAVRLDVTLTLTARQAQQWEAAIADKSNRYLLTVCNIPDYVYLLEGIDNSADRHDTDYEAKKGAAGYPAAAGIIENDPDPANPGGYIVKWPRIIIPAKYFGVQDDPTMAVRIQTYMKDGTTKALKGLVGCNILDPGLDYTLPRNHYITVNAKVISDVDLDLELGVNTWEDGSTDNTIGNRMLNVSTVEVDINERNMARVWFWSNQAEVAITGTLEGADVDDLFYGLKGPGATNFHYDPSTGEGYFDIMTDRDKALISAGSNVNYGLLLEGGGLTREVRVNVSIPNTAFAAYNYVGAFWRNDQTGERVIASPHSGSWTAATSDPWIILEAGKSLDLNLWSNKEPQNAENYQLENGSSNISGTGNIFFRIGLTDKNPGTDPRYGKVTVNPVGGTSYDIYVRQGEDADYLMRPGDGSGNGALSSRPNAKRYSPYNLTSAEYLASAGASQKTGGTNISGHSQIDLYRTLAAFTEYPTQAGAYFQWANATYPRYAWHPTYVSGNIPWNSSYPNTNNDYWTGSNNLGATHETCPPGYRRPNDGATNAAEAGTAASNILATSEQRQSLWWDPVVSTNNSITNVMWGYYADGFFDRYNIVTSQANSGTYANTAVSVNDYRVAYIGQLFYNPENNASLFFPAAGYRYGSNGQLSNPGTNGYFWSSSANNVNIGWTLYVVQNYASQSYTSRSYGFSVRCVVDE